MSDLRIKYQREELKVRGLEEFSHVARFSNTNSSLYQALTVGLIEILIRFKLSPNHIKVLKQGLGSIKNKAFAFADAHDRRGDIMGLFEMISNISEKAPDIVTAFN